MTPAVDCTISPEATPRARPTGSRRSGLRLIPGRDTLPRPARRRSSPPGWRRLPVRGFEGVAGSARRRLSTWHSPKTTSAAASATGSLREEEPGIRWWSPPLVTDPEESLWPEGTGVHPPVTQLSPTSRSAGRTACRSTRPGRGHRGHLRDGAVEPVPRPRGALPAAGRPAAGHRAGGGALQGAVAGAGDHLPPPPRAPAPAPW